jgi:cysteinyl-tRNA synthetase
MQDVIWEYIYDLEDDINTPEVLAVFHKFIKFINTWISEKSLTFEEYESIFDMLDTMNYVLWIIDFSILEETEIPQEILEKFELRNNAKKEKNFELADKLRDELLEFWYKIIDSREGTRLEKI